MSTPPEVSSVGQSTLLEVNGVGQSTPPEVNGVGQSTPPEVNGVGQSTPLEVNGARQTRLGQRADLPALRAMLERSYQAVGDNGQGLAEDWEVIEHAYKYKNYMCVVHEQSQPTHQILAYAAVNMGHWSLDLLRVDIAHKDRGLEATLVHWLAKAMERETDAVFLLLGGYRRSDDEEKFWRSFGCQTYPYDVSYPYTLAYEVQRQVPGFDTLRSSIRSVRECVVRLVFGHDKCTPFDRNSDLPCSFDDKCTRREIVLQAVRTADRVYFPRKIVEAAKQPYQNQAYTQMQCEVDGVRVFFGTVMAPSGWPHHYRLTFEAYQLGVCSADKDHFWLWGLLLGQRKPMQARMLPSADEALPADQRYTSHDVSHCDHSTEQGWLKNLDIAVLAREYDYFDKTQRLSAPFDWLKYLMDDPHELAKEFIGVMEGFAEVRSINEIDDSDFDFEPQATEPPETAADPETAAEPETEAEPKKGAVQSLAALWSHFLWPDNPSLGNLWSAQTLVNVGRGALAVLSTSDSQESKKRPRE